jgi:DNA helicase-2/ATP-dependent DNA helicase PcrA
LVDLYREILAPPVLNAASETILTDDEQAWLSRRGDLTLEDLAPLAYLRLLLSGPARVRNADGGETDDVQMFDHLVIDEGQDFAPLQFAVLQAHARELTILGDLAQSIHSYRGVKDWQEVIDALAAPQVSQAALVHGYRSTRQITDFANGILAQMEMPGHSLVDPFPRDGRPVEVLQVSSQDEVARVAAELLSSRSGNNLKTAAFLCRTVSHAREFAARLRHHYAPPVAVLTSRNEERSADVVVAPAYLAKGMEFDLVVIVDVDEQHYATSEYDAKLMYIAATRALHELVVLCNGTPSPLVPGDDVQPARGSNARSNG